MSMDCDDEISDDQNDYISIEPQQIFEDTEFMHSILPNQPIQDNFDPSEPFEVWVLAVAIHDNVLFAGRTIAGHHAQWRSNRVAALRKILALNKSFSARTTIVSDGRSNDVIDLPNGLATIRTKCAGFHRFGCKSKIFSVIDIKPLFTDDIESECCITTLYTYYDCDNHTGMHIPCFFGSDDRSKIGQLPPRQQQIKLLQETSFDPNSNNRNIPSRETVTNCRKEHREFKSLHKDMFTSLRLYVNNHKNDPRFMKLEALHRGDIHLLTAEPSFAFSIYNKESMYKLNYLYTIVSS